MIFVCYYLIYHIVLNIHEKIFIIDQKCLYSTTRRCYKDLLSTQGTADDVSHDLHAFLDYVDNGIITGDFVHELDKSIQTVKSNKKAMKEFMTFEMSLLKSRMEGEQRGLLQGRNQEKEFVALKMIRKGSSIDDILEITELHIEHIKQRAPFHKQYIKG